MSILRNEKRNTQYVTLLESNMEFLPTAVWSVGSPSKTPLDNVVDNSAESERINVIVENLGDLLGAVQLLYSDDNKATWTLMGDILPLQSLAVVTFPTGTTHIGAYMLARSAQEGNGSEHSDGLNLLLRFSQETLADVSETYPNPTVEDLTTPDDLTVGDDLVFSVDAAGNGAGVVHTVVFKQDGTTRYIETGLALTGTPVDFTYPNAQVSDSGDWTATVYNNYNSTESSIAVVTVTA